MEIKAITNKLLKFREDRDWEKFHKVKDLAISLSLEASELLEIFQWKTDEEVKELIKGDKLEDIKDEASDIASYLFLLCNDLGIDLIEAMENKIKKNELKYPVEKARGTSKKYTDL